VSSETRTGTILDQIVGARRAAVERRKGLIPLVVLRHTVEKGATDKKPGAARDFAAALAAAQSGMRIIAELKKASPSAGPLRADYQPGELAAALEQAGARALSVLTEEEFFQGALEHLKAARSRTRLPVLRKDFIFDPWQVWETRAAGADSFLLLAAILSDSLLGELVALGRELGMEPLVEVHTREELSRAVAAGARIIGVNNRDLRTFDQRLETSLELAEFLPDEIVAVSESGLHSREALEKLSRAGFDAFLVGEHLMTASDPGAALRALIGAAA
jgi:indole-3-glycerol phosphate synthase